MYQMQTKISKRANKHSKVIKTQINMFNQINGGRMNTFDRIINKTIAIIAMWVNNLNIFNHKNYWSHFKTKCKMRGKKQDIIKISSIQDIIKISNLLIDNEKTNHKDRY